jgi:hypothetical protein
MNKKLEYLKDKSSVLATNSKNKNIRGLYVRYETAMCCALTASPEHATRCSFRNIVVSYRTTDKVPN